MTISVKICGISTEEALEAAISAGADYAGFVFFPKSPRNVSIARAQILASQARDRIKTVALIVNADDEAVSEIVAGVRPDFLQLHGDETPQRVAAIKALSGARIIKAVKVASPADIVAAADYESAADILLFDAPPPNPSALPGGNGVPFDWTWLNAASLRANFMLSGGLNSDNVWTAVRRSGATAVDVSSGVESSPGKKDAALIRTFIEAAKSSEPLAPLRTVAL